MDISTYFGNAILNAVRGGGAGTSYTAPASVYLSAHTADPGLTGTSEVSGASYARTSIEFNAASGKVLTNTNQESLTMPSSGGPFLISFLGVWDAATTGNFLFKVPLLGSNHEVTADTANLFSSGDAHGLVASDRVEFENLGGALPTGVSAGTLYYVLATGLTTTAFKVSTTDVGTEVDITVAGGAIVRAVAAQSFNNGNILQVAAGALTVTF